MQREANEWGAWDGPEASELDVVLEDAGKHKVAVIREIRTAVPMGLKAAKDLTDSPPAVVAVSVSRDRAETIRERLERAGATVSLVPTAGRASELPVSSVAVPARGSAARTVVRLVFVLAGLASLVVGYRTAERAGWGIAVFVLGLFFLVLAASVGRRGA